MGKQVGFEERDAVEAPGGVGEFLDELRLGGSGGAVFVPELAEVLQIRGRVFGRQDSGAGGESVGQGVEGGALFAGLRFGAGGMLGVGAIDGGAAGRGVTELNGLIGSHRVTWNWDNTRAGPARERVGGGC